MSIERTNSRPTTRALGGALQSARNLVRALSPDSGREFADQDLSAIACEAGFYFANPYSLRKRRSNESTSGVVRPHLREGKDFAAVSNARSEDSEGRINRRSRKRLGCRSLFEVFEEGLNARVAVRN